MAVPAWTWRWPWTRWAAGTSPAWAAGPGGRRGVLRGHWRQMEGRMGRERPDCRPWEEGPAAGAQPYILCGESTAGWGRRRAGLAPPSCLQHMPRTYPSPVPPCPRCPVQARSPIPSHTGPRSTDTPHRVRMVTLRTYRDADKICGNRREGVRRGRGSAARSPAAPLCQWQFCPRDPHPAPGCWRGRGPRLFGAHLCSLS